MSDPQARVSPALVRAGTDPELSQASGMAGCTWRGVGAAAASPSSRKAGRQ